MEADYLHHHQDFPALIRIVAEKMGIAPVLVEKDYWIMHCLYGLQQLGMPFELKGGTSLSKGYGIIHRFSEDIDIRIEPPADLQVYTSRNHDKKKHIESRASFYEWLRANIHINGIQTVVRDHEFDDERLRSGGIRLHYPETTGMKSTLKEGILLEVGFDDVAPNEPRDISSWAYDHAVASKVKIIDNRAQRAPCYHPGYTLVEKLQTVSTKYRKQQEAKTFPPNFLRHYYDLYCLLGEASVQEFIGTSNYFSHKEKRFRSEEQNLRVNEAFVLSDPEIKQTYSEHYNSNQTLYYNNRPTFDQILERIRGFAGSL
jgi:predicted nucleotidyltransferase component of viral defense system